MKRWKWWVLGAVAAVAIGVVGGPYVYIHFIEGPAPAPLTISTSTPSTDPSASTAPTGSVDGTWNITQGSIVGYRVKEVLFGQSNTAVGRTSAITGTVEITGTTVSSASFTVDMTTVSSDRSRRDGQFQGRIMDTASFPIATFTLTQPIKLGTLPASGVRATASAVGNLTMHGVTKSVTVTLVGARTGNTVQVSGSVAITFADWNISNPSFPPTVTTEDHGTLEFLLNLTHV